MPRAVAAPPSSPRGYVEAGLMVALSTVAGLVIAPHWGRSAVDLLYLPAVLAAALLSGLRPALFSALASALAYNFFFTEPSFSLRIASPADLMTVLVLFLVAVITSQLAASARRQARLAAAHADRNAIIAGLAGRLLSSRTGEQIGTVATEELGSLIGCNVVMILASTDLQVIAAWPAAAVLGPNDLAAVTLTLQTGEPAGRALPRANMAEWQFHPVRSADGIVAAIGLARDDGAPPLSGGQGLLLGNLIDQVALALARARMEADARDFAAIRERDRVRSVLLATIADDLTPTVSTLLRNGDQLRRAGLEDRELVSSVGAEVRKLQRYIENLSDLGLDGDRQPVEARGVSIDLFRRRVCRDGVEVHLPPKEYAVLAELAKHPGRVLSHAHLLRTVWGPAQQGQMDYLRVAVRGLRQKLEADPARPTLIVNEPAVGYRLVAD